MMPCNVVYKYQYCGTDLIIMAEGSSAMESIKL
jgi:hypothetical protein